MSDTETPAEAPKKKSGKMKKIIVIVLGLIIVGGGGAGAGLYAMTGSIFGGGGGGHAAEDPDRPHLVVREGIASSVADEAKARALHGPPDPRVFQATYFPMEGNFTSNLRGGDAFVQIGLGVSTFYDERVVERLTAHQMAIRSAILETLSAQDPNIIATTAGKEELKQALRNTINNVLTIREGFGGIDQVYFTSFVTQ
jgi:flagellar FliL protein